MQSMKFPKDLDIDFFFFLMVGVEHFKATADVICQSFTDKFPDETTIHCMAYYSMLCGHG